MSYHKTGGGQFFLPSFKKEGGREGNEEQKDL